MKATGIVRAIDDLGRIVIPKEIRRTFNISEKDPLAIFVEEEKVILKKYEPMCTFCARTEETMHFRGKLICKKCIAEMSEQNI